MKSSRSFRFWPAAWTAVRRGVALFGMSAAALSGSARAAEVPDLPAPFSSGATAAGNTVAVDDAWQAMLADRAVEAGYYHLAEGVYRRELAAAAAGSTAHERLALGLVTTLIGQGKQVEAAAELATFGGNTTAAWTLRRALVDLLAGDYAQLGARVDDIDVSALPAADVAWHHFLRAMVFEHALNREQAEAEFAQALATSTSTAASAWFAVARFQMRFDAGEASAEAEQELQERMRSFAGQPQGFEATLQYAALLERRGRNSEAVQEIQRLRGALPPGQSDLRDRTLLLLGLIAGVTSSEGDEAMRAVLQNGSNPAWRRVALQRLAAGPAARSEGLSRIVEVLLTVPAEPLREDLYFFAAELAMRRSEYAQVEDYAKRLLGEFPGSSLTAGARGLLASAAWRRNQYRVAADNVARMREDLPDDGQHAGERARLAVLLGECHYQAAQQAGIAEDYRNAAEAFGLAQAELFRLEQAEGVATAERVAGASLGTVFFKRVLATIRGGNLDRAGELVLGPEAAQADSDSRWRAAWNLVRFLQLGDRADEAFRRIEQLNAVTDAPPDLRLRFLWLAAQLSVEAGRPEATAARVRAVREFLATEVGARIDADRRAEVESAAALLTAQAQLVQAAATADAPEAERLTAAGIAEMEKMRTDYRGSNAAVYSYIVQSRYLAEAGQLVGAQRLLQDLVAQYPNSVYAPLALFEAAELSVKRGGDAYLNEALDLLNSLLKIAEGSAAAKNYVFVAVLKQGDILRELRRYSVAEQAYLYLENTFPDDARLGVARLRLASTMLAQVAENPAKFEPAITLLERLTELPSADVALRAEAGFQLGYAWETHENLDRAAENYWGIYQRFLGDQPPGASTLGSKANYWVARALLQLAEIEQQSNRPEQALQTYRIWLERNLPFSAIARDRVRALQGRG